VSTAAGTERRTLGVRLLTPEGPLFDGVAQMVIVPSVAGEVGILARHAPFIAQLRVGDVRIHQPDGTVVIFATTEGYSAVDEDHLLVLVEQAELLEDIDRARAQAALERAEQELADASLEDANRITAEKARARAANRIRVADRAAG
jgi:F-type H+-transporting ATPase subunit epsilon